MDFKALLFDMDGVIVDTEPLHRKAWLAAFAEYGIEMEPGYYESFTGKATLPVSQEIVEKYQLDCTPEELVACKRKYFKDYFDNDEDFDLLPGVHELIQDLYNNGVKLILASSASMNTINWVFKRFGIEQYFSGKISGAELRESKPNPEIFLKAAEMANAKPEECVVIEDSTNGILAAKRAEIFTIGYKSAHSKNQDYSLADVVISNFDEVNYEKINIFVKS
ncbi:HAD family hydrolase [Ornithobacterium rhinotracheale]